MLLKKKVKARNIVQNHKRIFKQELNGEVANIDVVNEKITIRLTYQEYFSYRKIVDDIDSFYNIPKVEAKYLPIPSLNEELSIQFNIIEFLKMMIKTKQLC